MMLPNTGPTSTLMEDLSDLGLVEAQNKEPSAKSNAKGSGYAQPDAKGGDYAGPPPEGEGGYHKEGDFAVDAGDSAAGARRNVPVRQDGNVGPSASNPAKNEDEEGDEETVVESSGKMVPAFLIPTEEEVQEAEEQQQALAEEDRLSRAWEVVNTYFSEDDDGLNEEGLRGVINAMGYALNTAVEDIANLTVENERLTEAVNELTGLLHEAESGLYEGGYNGKMDYDDEDEDKDKDDDEDEEKKGKKLPPWLKGKKDDYEESRNRSANLTEDEDLASLASELSTLGESRATRAIDAQAELVEAYEGILSSCSEIVERIIDVMADDAGLEEGDEFEVDEDDERLQIARFFESIADDASKYLSRLADGDVPFKVAQADLGKLSADMEKGIDAMHTVE